MVDHVAVAVAVLDVGATHTNESLDVVGTKLNGVGIDPVDGAEQTVVNRDLARAAFAERKVALHIDELRQHEGGVLDAGLNEGATSKVQVNRFAARWHSQSFRTKAADEINGWLGLGRALPAVAPVHSDFDVLTIQLEDVATAGDHKLTRRSLERGELGNDVAQLTRGLHDGQRHVDIGHDQAKDALLIPDQDV